MLFLLFLVPGLLLGIWAQIKLHHAYNKYSEVPTESGLSGAEAARRILDDAGLNNVPVERVEGQLTDHYDPTKRALVLSEGNYDNRTIAAVGVAAHEAGHALQHQQAWALFNARMALVPITQFASAAYMGIFFLGFIFHSFNLMLPIVIGIFSIITLFQLVTLPVEYDASSRAKVELFRLGLVREPERAGVSQVLNAAALTYVAALVSSILQLLYYITAARSDRS